MLEYVKSMFGNEKRRFHRFVCFVRACQQVYFRGCVNSTGACQRVSEFVMCTYQ